MSKSYHTTRPEREQRIDADDGALHDDVYVSVRPDSSGNRAKQGSIYHDDADCRYLQGDVKDKTREKAQNHWQAPCKGCIVPDFSMQK